VSLSSSFADLLSHEDVVCAQTRTSQTQSYLATAYPFHAAPGAREIEVFKHTVYFAIDFCKLQARAGFKPLELNPEQSGFRRTLAHG
jgi:hypothetical protein